MTTSKEHISLPLRLELAPVPGAGLLDGAWWPRSRDLEHELADLVDHFPPQRGRVSRVIFSRPDWLTVPRRVRVGRGYMKTGSFPRDDTHVVLLKLSSEAQLKVLVVPPGEAEDSAQRMMATAVAPTNRRTAPALVARGHLARSGDAAGRWTDDGGARSTGA